MNRPDVGAGCRSLVGPGTGAAGSSLVEVLAVVVVLLVLAAIAVPPLGSQRDHLSAIGAARHMVGLIHQTRADAVRRGVHVGLMFEPGEHGMRFAAFADGNRDGLRSTDISVGVDRQVTPWAYLDDTFPRTAFGIAPGVTDPDSSAPLGGSPVKLGGGSLLSFGPSGGATSGTVYLRGPSEQQYAIRILGGTGRSRLLRFDFRARRWTPA